METLLINTLSTFNCPVIKQGSMNANEQYEEKFFTYWNNTSDDDAHYDNVATSTIWDFDVNFYGTDPNVVYDTLIEAIELLRKAGFIISGKGYDVASDEVTHTGRGINALYIERN